MKRTIMVLLVVFTAIGIWAQGGSESGEEYLYSHKRLADEPYGGRVMVSPNQDIVNIFEKNGVAKKYLNVELAKVPIDMRDIVDDVLDDDADGILDLIKNQLQKEIKKDNVDYAYMKLGQHIFSFTVDYDD